MNSIYPDKVIRSNSSMNYIYPDMDLDQSIDDNLRHGNTKKYKKFKRQFNKVRKEWDSADFDGTHHTTTSYLGMCETIGKYQIFAISKL